MPPSDLARAVFVDFPLDGEWIAVNTPAERVPSHGTNYFGQRYAYDFIRVGADRRSYSTEPAWKQVASVLPVQAFLAWDQPVHAAFSGTVVSGGDGWPDRLSINALWQSARALFFAQLPRGSDYRPLAGNNLVITGAEGVAVYAHLRNGSVRFRAGDTVRAGEEIGRVGNSGNTTMPHLHFQVMDGPDPLTARGVLCGFRDYERFAGDDWQAVDKGVPARVEPIRFRR